MSKLLAQGQSYSSNNHFAVSSFEIEFVQRHIASPGWRALMTGSGTAALLAAFFALGLEAGDEVLAPAISFPATVTPAHWLGLSPTFCDCDPRTGLVDLSSAAEVVSPRTRALVVTHLWGQRVDLEAARRFCDAHELFLVEDCSHAHGRRDLCVHSDVAVFSVGTKKLVSGGMGGVLLARDDSILDRAVLLTQARPRARELIGNAGLRDLAETGIGLNLRPSPISAVLAADHLARIDEIIEAKNRNLRLASSWLTALDERIDVAPVPDDDIGTLYSLPVRFSLHSRQREQEDALAGLVQTLSEAELRPLEVYPALPGLGVFRRHREAGDGAVRPLPGAEQLLRTSVRLDCGWMHAPLDAVAVEAVQRRILSLRSRVLAL